MEYGELEKSSEQYKKRLDGIISKPLTVENINSYGNDAIEDVIALTEDIKKDPAYKWTFAMNDSMTKEQEDEIFSEALGEDVEKVLDRIDEVQGQINDLDSFLSKKRENPESKVYVPTDARDMIMEGNGGGISQNKIIPKTKMALFLLENDFGVDIRDPEQCLINTGTLKQNMMRSVGYDMITVPDINRIILSCDESGNRTFVFNLELLKEKNVKNVEDFSKEELAQLIEQYPQIGQSLIYTVNYADRLKNALNNIEKTNISAGEAPKKAEYLKNIEYVPEGYETIRGIAREIGIDDGSLAKYINNSGIEPTQYKDKGGHLRGFYKIEDVKNIKEIQELSNAEYAPEDYSTIDDIARKIGISHWALAKYINNSGLEPVRYKDKKGHLWDFYKIEDVKNIKEIQKLLNTEYAPEDYDAIGAIAQDIGINNKTLAKYINNSGLEPVRYKDKKGHLWDFYKIEDVKNIKEIQKLLNTEYAPEGYGTIHGIAREIGITDEPLAKYVNNSRLESVQYKDMQGHLCDFYKIEDVKSIKEVQEFLKRKSQMEEK